MSRKKSFRRQCIWQIKQQYNRGKHLTSVGKGHYTQKQSGKFASYKAVWSDNSRDRLISSTERISKIIKDNDIEVRRLSDLNLDTVTQIMQAENDAGYSASTMQSDILAINHVAIGSGSMSVDDHFTKAKINDNAGSEIVPKRSGDIADQRYKALDATEWIDRNEDKYTRWQEPIDFIRGTGFRRRETEDFSVVKDEDDHIWAMTPYGKGGKTRFAEVRDDYKDAVLTAVGKSEEELPVVGDDEKQKILDDHDYAEGFVRLHDDSVTIPKDCPAHIFRADYAKGLAEQLSEEKDYSDSDPYVSPYGATHPATEEHTIGVVTAPYGALMEVSESMGHNRLDVLSRYFNR